MTTTERQIAYYINVQKVFDRIYMSITHNSKNYLVRLLPIVAAKPSATVLLSDAAAVSLEVKTVLFPYALILLTSTLLISISRANWSMTLASASALIRIASASASAARRVASA
jgi:hypothetical protein